MENSSRHQFPYANDDSRSFTNRLPIDPIMAHLSLQSPDNMQMCWNSNGYFLALPLPFEGPKAASLLLASRASISAFFVFSSSSRSSFSAYTLSVSKMQIYPIKLLTCFLAASASLFSLISFNRAKSALASSVFPASCNF